MMVLECLHVFLDFMKLYNSDIALHHYHCICQWEKGTCGKKKKGECWLNYFKINQF